MTMPTTSIAPDQFSSARNRGGKKEPSDAAIRNERQPINVPLNFRAWDHVARSEADSDLMAWFHQHCVANRFDRGQVAAILGRDKTNAVRILAGSYGASDWSSIFAAVAAYRETQIHKHNIGGIDIEPEWVTTAPGHRFRQALGHAGRGGFSIIAGPSGVGKTKTCDTWDKAHPGRMVRVRAPFNGSANALIKAIAKALGQSYRNYSVSDLQLMLADKFTGRQILLVDQGSRLIPSVNQVKAAALEVLMDLYEDGIGIVLPLTLRDLTQLADFRYQIEQVTRRAEIFAAPAIEREDVERIAAQFGAFSQATLTALFQLALKPGAFGTVVHILNVASELAADGKAPLSDPHITRAIANRFARLPNGRDPFDK